MEGGGNTIHSTSGVGKGGGDGVETKSGKSLMQHLKCPICFKTLRGKLVRDFTPFKLSSFIYLDFQEPCKPAVVPFSHADTKNLISICKATHSVALVY